MRFFFALLLFAGGVALCTLVAKVVYQGSVEAELAGIAEKTLIEEGFDGVEVEFDHHAVQLSGFVDAPEDKNRVLEVIRKAVPVAVIPPPGQTGLEIRPTIPPTVVILKNARDTGVTLDGALGENGEETRALLGSRLHGVETVESVENLLELDPKRLPLTKAAELSALAGDLLKHSDAVEVRLENDALFIKGVVPNEGIKSGLMELASKVGAAEISGNIKVTPPETFFTPATFSLTRNRFGITATGVVSDAETSAALSAVIEGISAAGRVTKEIKVGEGVVEAGWEEVFPRFLPVLAELLQGEMTLELGEKQFRLSGEVADEAAKEKVIAAFASARAASPGVELLSDLRVQTTTDQGPEVRLLVIYEDGLLSLTGNVPDDSFVAALEETFQNGEEEVLIKNSLEVTKSSPDEGWSRGLRELLEEIPSRTENAVIRLGDSVLQMEGITVELADRQLLQNVAVNAVPAGFTVDNRLIHKDQPFPMPELLPEAREKLAEGLKGFPVYFDTGSDELNEDARKAVNSIFALLKEGGAQVPLTVTGYADNVGNAESNRQLSLSRASSVTSLLTELGVDEAKIAQESRVEDVSGVRRSERWKSRRVEVSLSKSEEDSSGE